MNDYFDIKKAMAFENKIFIIFKNEEIKVLEPKHLIGDIHSKNISKKNIWKQIKYDEGGIYWTKYLVLGQPYEIGADILYKISRKPTKEELTHLLVFFSKNNKIKHKKLADFIISIF